MSVFRVKKDANYTVINNTCLRDPNLSWKAKGLHAYMVSMPDDWVFYNEELATRATDGKDSLKAAIKELSNAGYLQRKRKHNEKGRFDGWETIVYELPQPKAEKPTDGKTDSRESRQTEKPQLLSTEELSTNELSTEDNTSVNPFATYQQNIGVMNAIITQSIIYYTNEFNDEIVNEAIIRAVKAGRMNWGYCEGILKEWQRRNVKSMQDIASLDTEFANRSNPSSRKKNDIDWGNL